MLRNEAVFGVFSRMLLRRCSRPLHLGDRPAKVPKRNARATAGKPPGGSAGLQALTGRQLEISTDAEATGDWQNFFQRIEVTVAT